jgi:glutamate-1-semialdehyde 2,1-aminomutase
VGFGSAIGLQILGNAKNGIKDAIYLHLLQQGIMIARRGFIMFNLMHSNEHVDRLLAGSAKTVDCITSLDS